MLIWLASDCSQEGICNFTPLVYFHGHTAPKDNIDLYKTLVSTLAEKVNQRLDRDADTKASGIIVNTCGWVDGAGLDVLLHCIKALSINIVLVVNNDKLFSTLSSNMDQPSNKSAGVTVVKLPVSGGVVTRVRPFLFLSIRSNEVFFSSGCDY